MVCRKFYFPYRINTCTDVKFKFRAKQSERKIIYKIYIFKYFCPPATPIKSKPLNLICLSPCGYFILPKHSAVDVSLDVQGRIGVSNKANIKTSPRATAVGDML